MLPDNILEAVESPAQYIGGEVNAVVKDPADVEMSFALCYPDAYEVGMSHLGSQILYHVINSHPGVQCERVFHPWIDAAELMRQQGVALSGLETGRPLHDFDIVGITLQYELTYTTILSLLELGGITLRTEQRRPGEPIIIAGGPCAYNPEPLADFFDALVIGDGEEVVGEIIDLYLAQPARFRAADARTAGDREDFLRQLALIEGVYVPSLYEVQRTEEGLLCPHPTSADVPDTIRRRIVRDFESASFPEAPVVPWLEVVHDRAQLEIARGCVRGCRFCQAGIIYRPVREKSMGTLRAQAHQIIASTGFDDIALASLNCPDYSGIEELIDGLHADLADQRVSVSLPSLRTDTFSVSLAEKIQRVRKSGLTLAPEAGSDRLRAVINKNVSDKDLFEAVEAAFAAGWETIKLYFMIGLPGETDRDLEAIGQLVEEVVQIGQRKMGRRRGHLQVNVSVACLIPKPHTPFQWRQQITHEELRAKQGLLKNLLDSRYVNLSYHSAEGTIVETVISRGDRSLGAIIELVYRSGAVLEAWGEQFCYENWTRAFATSGRDLEAEACRQWPLSSPLPWQHINAGVSPEFLQREATRAEQAIPTDDCRTDECPRCGLNDFMQPCPMMADEKAPAAREQTVRTR